VTSAVLVPLDGSHVAEAALPFAGWLADRLRSDVKLLTVLDSSERGDTSQEAARVNLESLASRLRAGGRAVSTDVHEGKSAETIADVAASEGVSVVVLTTYGHGGDAHHLGGTSERLSRTLSKAALFVSPASDVQAPVTGPLLVALDGSSTAELALQTAQDLARQLHLTVKLVRVAPWANELFAAFTGLAPPSADEEIELGSNTYLAGLVEQLPKSVDSDYQTLRGHAAQMLVEYGADQKGILVQCSHGETASQLWHLGSTTDKVLRAASVPVLLVPIRREP